MILELLQRSVAIALLAAAPSTATLASRPLTLVDADEPGQRLTVLGRVVDAKGQPIATAELRVYQTDLTGRYTRDRAMDESHARLSGLVRSDAGGHFEIRTIRPGGYPNAVRLGDKDRKIPAHIHIEVSASGFVSRKVQVVFADDPLLANPYWQEWAKKAGHPVVTVTREGSTQVARVTLPLQRASTSISGSS